MADIELNFVDFAKLDLQDDDIIVARVPGEWDDDRQDHLWRALMKAAGDAGVRVQVLVGTKDVDISILRPSKDV